MDPPTGFKADQIKQLSAPLDRSHVKQRQQGSARVSYVEGWHVISEANEIFGFDRWHRETLDLTCVSEKERKIGGGQKPGWGVTYSARVRVTVFAHGITVVRDGCGAGHGIDVDLGQAHESALKEAETDAMKRALMTFGNPFGLALYDKEQKEVQGSPASPTRPTTSRPAATRPAPAAPTPPRAAPARPGPSRPASTATPLTLAERAHAKCRECGLTNPEAIQEFLSVITNGEAKWFDKAPVDILEKLIARGVSSETVAQYQPTVWQSSQPATTNPPH